jgi:endonuclease/exonuclease/phosphatase family metal-dependent hydrolase
LSGLAEESDKQLFTVKDCFRLFVWNCAGAFHQKYAFVEQFDPDLAIVCEATKKSLSASDAIGDRFWIGRHGGRGVAILAYKGWQIRDAGFDCSERWFLPTIASNGNRSVRIVGVCAQKAENYVAPTLRAIRQMRPFLIAGPAIVAGDFNQSLATDHKYPLGQRSSDMFNLMTGLEMRSAWHSHSGETHGRESQPTHYWGATRKPFHIDYAFVSKDVAVQAVHIPPAKPIAGLSDHAPVIVDFQLASPQE